MKKHVVDKILFQRKCEMYEENCYLGECQQNVTETLSRARLEVAKLGKCVRS